MPLRALAGAAGMQHGRRTSVRQHETMLLRARRTMANCGCQLRVSAIEILRVPWSRSILGVISVA